MVKPVQFHLSFQSRVGPVQWLRPYTDDKIRELAVQGKVRTLACDMYMLVGCLCVAFTREYSLKKNVFLWSRTLLHFRALVPIVLSRFLPL